MYTFVCLLLVALTYVQITVALHSLSVDTINLLPYLACADWI